MTLPISDPNAPPVYSRAELKVVPDGDKFRVFITLVPNLAGVMARTVPFLDPFGNPLMPTYELAEELGVALIWELLDMSRGNHFGGPLD